MIKVNQVVVDIASASEQQSSGVEEIATALQQMNQITQQTAANSEESASASEELSSQSNEMRSMVDSFNLTDVRRRFAPGPQKPVAPFTSHPQEVKSNQYAKKKPVVPLAAGHAGKAEENNFFDDYPPQL